VSRLFWNGNGYEPVWVVLVLRGAARHIRVERIRRGQGACPSDGRGGERMIGVDNGWTRRIKALEQENTELRLTLNTIKQAVVFNPILASATIVKIFEAFEAKP